MSVFVIAEAGVNHNGDMEMARRLIDVAVEAGADAVKFQTFQAATLATRTAPKAEYQTRTTQKSLSQYEMLCNLELPRAEHFSLMAYCQDRHIEFVSTPFDIDSLRFLVNDLGLTRLKIPSGELTNGPLLLAAGESSAGSIILSTGMATMDEIRDACGAVVYGMLGGRSPGLAAFREALASAEGQRALRERITILQCTTEYPAPIEEANLRAMDTIRRKFSVATGYSDHTIGVWASVAAAALGADIIEKHFTLDRTLPGPDHAASLEPDELANMIAGIRAVEASLGDGVKRPTPMETKNMVIARKSLTAATPVGRGDAFTTDNLAVKRPGDGVSPMRYWEYIGRLAERDYDTDDQI